MTTIITERRDTAGELKRQGAKGSRVKSQESKVKSQESRVKSQESGVKSKQKEASEECSFLLVTVVERALNTKKKKSIS